MDGEEWVGSSDTACHRRARASAVRSTQHSTRAAFQQATIWRRDEADRKTASASTGFDAALCDNRIAPYSRAMDLKWLAEQLARPGYSQAGLARALGKDAAAANRMLKGERLIKLNELPAIIGYLGVAPPPGDPVTAMVPIRRVHDPAHPDVPVWASAEAGQDGAMVLVSEPIDYIRRSERMQGVKSPFAFYMIGGSMSPAIEHGDQVVVNPALPIRTGGDCVFIHEESGSLHALVKRLLRVTADHWRVRQYNPPKDFDLPKKKWPRAQMISEKRYC
jgi:phage repressor protein C with HTH and peptisase S24 domain